MKVEDFFQEGKLIRIISGCIRDAMNLHGNITKELIGSVAKRIASQLLGIMIYELEKQNIDCVLHDKKIFQMEKEIKELMHRLNRANSQESRWRKKCQEHGIPLGDKENVETMA